MPTTICVGPVFCIWKLMVCKVVKRKKTKNRQIDNYIVLPKTANVFMKVYNIYIDGTTSIFGD